MSRQRRRGGNFLRPRPTHLRRVGAVDGVARPAKPGFDARRVLVGQDVVPWVVAGALRAPRAALRPRARRRVRRLLLELGTERRLQLAALALRAPAEDNQTLGPTHARDEETHSTTRSEASSLGWKTRFPMLASPVNFLVIRIGSQFSFSLRKFLQQAPGERRSDGEREAPTAAWCPWVPRARQS